MLPAPALPAAFTALSPVHYRNNLYRAIRPDLLTRYPLLAGGGPVVTGARFTPKGTFATLYLAESPDTAYEEMHHVGLRVVRRTFDPFAARFPITAVLPVRVELPPIRILDLTRQDVLVQLGTTTAEIHSPWIVPTTSPTPPTHVLGSAVHSSGIFQAIRYPSARDPDGVCLAVFPSHLSPTTPGYVELDDRKAYHPDNTGHVAKIP